MLLDEICIINMGQSPESDTYNEDCIGVPFFQGNADFGEIYPRKRVWCSNPTKIAQARDILISVRAPIGAMNIADCKCCIGRGLAALTIKSTDFDVKYVWYALKAKVGDLISQGTGSTFKAINKKILANTEIIIPSVEEQKAIAEKLDKVSILIEKRKQQLSLLDTIVKSKFVEMFGQENREDALINLCQFIDYRGKTPNKTDSGLPFITAKNIKMHYMSFDVQEYISKDTYDKVMTRGFPKEGDVVFTTEAPLGNVCRIPIIYREFYIGQRIITMQTTVLEPAYLEYALSSDAFKKKLAEKSSGSTVTGIRSKLLEKLTIPIPDREKQKQFAQFIERTEQLKAKIKQSLAAFELLKKSLMKKYFG